MCPQPSEDLTEVSEDCLRLNIYTHDVNFYFVEFLLPVELIGPVLRYRKKHQTQQ